MATPTDRATDADHPAVGRISTPLDVVLRIAQYLDDTSSRRTLAALSIASKATYELLMPIVYSHLLINGRRSHALFDVDLAPTPSASRSHSEFAVESKIAKAQIDGTFFHPACSARRLWALSLVRSLSIRCFPDEDTSQSFQNTVALLDLAVDANVDACSNIDAGADADANGQADAQHPRLPRHQALFPNLHHVELEPSSVDAIRTYQPDAYDIPHSPPFLEALAATSTPTILALHFRTVPSARWEHHAASTSNGAYNFVSRLNQLHRPAYLMEDLRTRETAGWHSITRLEVYGAVHQVLPSLVGVTNVYHFAPHIAVPPENARLSRPGAEPVCSRDAMAGPHWSYRGWQCLTAIKNVYTTTSSRERSRSRSRSAPTSRAVSRVRLEQTHTDRPGRSESVSQIVRSGDSRDDAGIETESELQRLDRERVESTRWQFFNLRGHVMVQAKSSCEPDGASHGFDDEEKAGEDVVEGLIKSCVGVSVGRDIPGVKGDDVDGILARIRWA